VRFLPRRESDDVLVPEIRNPPEHGAAIWVFEVPAAKLR